MKVQFASQRDERSCSAFFRTLNDYIVAQSARDQNGALQILCECSRRDCDTTLQITADEYRAVRADDTHFLMASGHERTEVQEVVFHYGRIAVVQERESGSSQIRSSQPPQRGGRGRSCSSPTTSLRPASSA